MIDPSTTAGLEDGHEMTELNGTTHEFHDMDTGDVEKPRRKAGFTQAESNAVRKKLDKRVVGLISLLYLLSFLDRSSKYSVIQTKLTIDIGNAKIAGMMNDLRLSNDQYEWLLTIFYFSYIAFEWMALL
jgi:hypothetical protein